MMRETLVEVINVNKSNHLQVFRLEGSPSPPFDFVKNLRKIESDGCLVTYQPGYRPLGRGGPGGIRLGLR